MVSGAPEDLMRVGMDIPVGMRWNQRLGEGGGSWALDANTVLPIALFNLGYTRESTGSEVFAGLGAGSFAQAQWGYSFVDHAWAGRLRADFPMLGFTKLGPEMGNWMLDPRNWPALLSFGISWQKSVNPSVPEKLGLHLNLNCLPPIFWIHQRLDR